MDFAAYAAVFPQLITGPIVRCQEVDQLMTHRRHSTDAFYAGPRRFLVGRKKRYCLPVVWPFWGKVFHGSAETSMLFYWLYGVPSPCRFTLIFPVTAICRWGWENCSISPIRKTFTTPTPPAAP